MKQPTRRDMLAGIATSAVIVPGLAETASLASNQASGAGKTGFQVYDPKSFNFEGLKGLEKDLLDQHYALYKGYVTNVNKAQGEISELLHGGKTDTAALAETRRRLGFEFAGMRLHEIYFGALKPEGSRVNDKLKAAVSNVWGSWENWIADITRTALMRGIGWAILYRDPVGGSLQNFWASDHENGHPPGFTPVFAIDVWEHAYVRQFGAGGRKTYLEALLKNIDWETVAKRLD